MPTEKSAERIDITADLAALRDDVAKLSATMTDLLRREAKDTGEKVRAAADTARDGFAHSAADAQEKVHSATAQLEATIERNPIVSVMLALIVGLLFGISSRGRQ